MDIGCYIGIVLLQLLKSSFRIHVPGFTKNIDHDPIWRAEGRSKLGVKKHVYPCLAGSVLLVIFRQLTLSVAWDHDAE